MALTARFALFMGGVVGVGSDLGPAPIGKDDRGW